MSHDEEKRPTTPEATVVEDKLDHAELRKLSLQPGGFGEQRAELWAKLLHAQPLMNAPSHPEPTESILEGSDVKIAQVELHPDEEQIRKDTDRSFVLYPVGDMKDREERQQKLLELITALFRKRRRMRYFQGYHDIISVVFLTMSEEYHLPAVEKLSLHRLRDNMGTGLEPVTGLMRVLKRVLQLADPEYAAILDRTSPLPFYALSNLLTLCSHDVPTLPLIQRVFDYLLCRPPIFIVYLVAAITLTRKAEVQRLEQEDEEGMMHSVLNSIPDLYVDDPSQDPPRGLVNIEKAHDADASETSENASQRVSQSRDVGEEAQTLAEDVTPLAESPDSKRDEAETTSQEQQTSPATTKKLEETPEASLESIDAPTPCPPEDATLVDDSVSSEKDEQTLVVEERPKSLHSLEPSVATFKTAPDVPPEGEEEEDDIPRRPRIALCSLLEKADELHALFPPTHPSVHVESIMGPQSVVYTWSENVDELPDDDEAELMVLQPQLIVLPFVEEPEGKEEGEGEPIEVDRHKRHRRHRLRKPRRIGGVVVERRAVVASAVLVLGVAMAVYGIQAAPDAHGGTGRELRRLSRVLGGFVVGFSGKLWSGLVGMSG